MTAFRDLVLDQISLRLNDKCWSNLPTLSDRELEVMILTGRSLTRENIARMLEISVKSVDSYKSHIKRKLGLKNAMQLNIFSFLHSLIEG